MWAARFFKSRALAAHACEMGRVQVAGQQVKASREIHAADRVRVKNDSGDFEIDVLGLSQMRGPASVAQALYRETEESREARMRAIEERRAMLKIEAVHEGRPSKRDRRQLTRLRGRG